MPALIRVLSLSLVVLVLSACGGGGGGGSNPQPTPADKTPDAFRFVDVHGMFPGTLATSQPVSIKGMDADVTVPIKVQGGEYRIDNQPWTRAKGQVGNGASVRVRGFASDTAAATFSVHLTVGDDCETGACDAFDITTVPAGTAADTVPDDYELRNPDPAGVTLGESVVSDPIIVSGTNAGTTISIGGDESAQYRIEGGAWTRETRTVYPGQTVEVRITAPGTSNSVSEAALTIGGVTEHFTVITPPADGEFDTVPDPLPRDIASDVVNTGSVALGQSVTFGPFTPTGFVGETTARIIPAEHAALSIDGGATWHSADTIELPAGVPVLVRLTAPFTPATRTEAILTLSGVSTTFAITTANEEGADSEPDPASLVFAPKTVSVGEQVVSDSVVPIGYNRAAELRLAEAAKAFAHYRIDGGGWTQANSVLLPGQSLELRITAPERLTDTDNGSLTAHVTVGGVGGSFTATVTAPDQHEPPTVVIRGPSQFNEGQNLDIAFHADVNGGSARISDYQWLLRVNGNLSDDFAGQGFVVSGAETGTLLIHATPDIEETSQYEIAVVVTDDIGVHSEPAIKVIAVNPVSAGNQPPTVVVTGPLEIHESANLPEPVTLVANANDPDGEIANYVWGLQVGGEDITDFAAHGFVVSGEATDALTIHGTPDVIANSAYAFTVIVTDDTGAKSNQAVHVLTVLFVNQSPEANDDAFITDEDVPLEINVAALLANDRDPDGQSLAITQVHSAVNGLVELNSERTQVRFVPALDFYGSASFKYAVTDGMASSTATVRITVNSVNDAPIAVADSRSISMNSGSVALRVLDNDTDVDSPRAQWRVTRIVSAPDHGGVATIADDGSDIHYRPATGFEGMETFSYVFSDGDGAESNAATVTLTVTNNNINPVAVDDAVETDEDTSVDIDVLANDYDADGDRLTVNVSRAPRNGRVQLIEMGGTTFVRYTPNQDFNGSDDFGYTVNDGNGGSASATVFIAIHPVNDAPVALLIDPSNGNEPSRGPVAFSVNEGATAFMLDGSMSTDPDGDALVYSWAVPTGFVATDANSAILAVTATPDVIEDTNFTITLTVTDPEGISDSADAIITVRFVNRAPTVEIVNPPVSVKVGSAFMLTGEGDDPDEDNENLAYAWTVPAAFIEFVDGVVDGDRFLGKMLSLNGTPDVEMDPGFTFTLVVTDSHGLSASSSVMVTIAQYDTVPGEFEFAPAIDVEPRTWHSVFVTVTDVDAGIDVPYILSTELATSDVRLVRLGGLRAWSGVVRLGDVLELRILSSSLGNTSRTAHLEIGGVGAVFEVKTRDLDQVPDPIVFEDILLENGVDPRTVVISSPVILSGFEGPFDIRGIGIGSYRINGGAWLAGGSAWRLVQPGDSIELRTDTTSTFGAKHTMGVEISPSGREGAATYRGEWTVYNRLRDSSPEFSDFVSVEGVERNDIVVSEPQLLTAFDGPLSVTVANGKVAVSSDEGANWSEFAATGLAANAGDYVKVMVESSSEWTTPITATITVGTETRSFTVTTRAQDTAPDAFSDFTAVEGADPGEQITSNKQMLSGFDGPLGVFVTNGEAAVSVDDGINWSEFSATAHTVNPGDYIMVRTEASSSWKTSVTAEITVGVEVRTFTVTTRAQDTTPDGFVDFDLVDDVEPRALMLSNRQVLSGFDGPIEISVSGGKAAVSSDGGSTWSEFASEGLSVNPDDVIMIQAEASADWNTEITARVTVGTEVRSFSVITRAQGTTPDGFIDFAPVQGVEPHEQVVSNTQTLSGFDGPLVVEVVDGEAAVSTDGGLTWSEYSASGHSIYPGDQLRIQVVAPSEWNTWLRASVTIGTETREFSIRTRDITPGGFENFTAVEGVASREPVVSNTQTLTDFDGPLDVVVVDGEAAVSTDEGLTWSEYAAGGHIVNPGDQLRLRVEAADWAMSVNASVTIGTVTRHFHVTTRAKRTMPDDFSIDDVEIISGTELVLGPYPITGIDPDVMAVISGGWIGLSEDVVTATELSLGGDDALFIKVYAPDESNDGDSFEVTLTIGESFTRNFLVTVRARDDEPDSFNLGSVDNAPWGYPIDSNLVTISGINVPVPVSISLSVAGEGGDIMSAAAASVSASINGGSFVDPEGSSIRNGDTIRLRVQTPESFVTVTARLVVGTVSGNFVVTTQPSDLTPDPFTFASVTNAEPNVWIESESVQLQGFDDSSSIFFQTDGLQYRLGESEWRSVGGAIPVEQHENLTVRLMVAGFEETSVGYINVGEYQTTFSVSTRAEVRKAELTQPDVLEGVVLESAGHSANVEISGIDNPQPVNIVGDDTALFSLDGGASWLDANATGNTVSAGQTVVLQVDAADTFSTPTAVTLIVGTGEDSASVTFTVITEAEDDEPNAMSFGSVTEAPMGSLQESVIVVVSGINTRVTAALSGDSDSSAEFRRRKGVSQAWSDWSREPLTDVTDGHELQLRLTASDRYFTTSTAGLLVGSGMGEFQVRTESDVTPPEVEMVFPSVSGTLTTAHFITLRARVSDDDRVAIVRVLKDGEERLATDDDADDTWIVTIDLERGENHFTVIAEDAAGNRAELPYAIERVEESPILLSQFASDGGDTVYVGDVIGQRMLEWKRSTGTVSDFISSGSIPPRALAATSAAVFRITNDSVIQRVDRDTRNVTTVTYAALEGPGFPYNSRMVADEAGGRLYVYAVGPQPRVIVVRMDTGFRSTRSSNSHNGDHPLPSGENVSIAMDGANNVFVAGDGRIQRILPNGTRTTIAAYEDGRGDPIPEEVVGILLAWRSGTEEGHPGELIAMFMEQTGSDPLPHLYRIDLETLSRVRIAHGSDEGGVPLTAEPIVGDYRYSLVISDGEVLYGGDRRTGIISIDLDNPIHGRTHVLDQGGPRRGVRIGKTSYDSHRMATIDGDIYLVNESDIPRHVVSRLDYATGNLDFITDSAYDNSVKIQNPRYLRASASKLYLLNSDRQLYSQALDERSSREHLGWLAPLCGPFDVRDFVVDNAGRYAYVLSTGQELFRITLPYGGDDGSEEPPVAIACELISHHDSGVGDGPSFNGALNLGLDPANDRLLVTGREVLIAVDLISDDGEKVIGTRRLVASDFRLKSSAEPIVSYEQNRIIMVANDSVVAVSMVDGSVETLFFPWSQGEGPRWVAPVDVILYPDGRRLLVVSRGQLTEADLGTGDRVIISR